MNQDLHTYAADLFRGDRVRLRRFREDDLRQLDAWWNDPEWMIFQGGRIAPVPEATTSEMFRAWSSNTSHRAYGFSIESTGTGELVGHVTVWGIDPVVRAGTLAIIIGGEHVGQGFGTDAMRVMMRFVFEELGINKIELQVWSYNERARRTYEKVGFRVEGTRRDATFHDGRYWDEIHMGILRSEYLAGR